VAATNHDLEADIKNGAFREDLYYRLKVICLHMPGLDRRPEDIPLLARHFMKKYALLYQKKIERLSETALKHLGAHTFSGNVRELENMIERGVIFCRTTALEPEDIFPGAVAPADIHSGEIPGNILDMPFREAKEAALSLFYNQYIRSALTHSGGNISRAAEKAGIQRQYLHRLIKEAGLEAEGFKLPPD
jgi:DNA-binding NtrC family response regulator